MPTEERQFDRVLAQGAELIQGLLRSFAVAIEKAYLRAEDGLRVGLGLTISPPKRLEETHHLEVEIRFVADQIKDKWGAGVPSMDQGQMELDLRPLARIPGPPHGHPQLRHPGWRASYGSEADRLPFLYPDRKEGTNSGIQHYRRPGPGRSEKDSRARLPRPRQEAA